jgi:glycosyltransferase involved in cell wall biosynthesis
VDFLINAFRNIYQSCRDISLLIVGDGSERQILSDLAQDLERVHFLGHIPDEKELAKFFLLSDLLVIPGRTGLATIHGFCFDVPFITTAPEDMDKPDSPEYAYLRHGENGLFVKETTEELYTEAILNLLNDQEKLEKMQRQAKSTAESLTIASTVSQFCNGIRYAVEKAS